MRSLERIYEASVQVLSVGFILIGIAILVVTLSAGGGALALGTLMGVAFVAIGCGRLWLASRMRS